MKDQDWIDKYNGNFLAAVKEHGNKEDSHIYVNQSIVDFCVKHIEEAKVQYYIEGSDYMSDAAYDRLEHILKIHNPNHPLLSKVGVDKV